MIVVSDTSPLNYFVLLDIAHVLPSLFDEVVIPPAVLADLSRSETPTKVRNWASSRPDWLRVEAPTTVLADLDLDPGETEAISLAVARHADALLIDDRKGRRAASQYGITTISTLSVLEAAAKINLISLPEVIEQLASALLNNSFKSGVFCWGLDPPVLLKERFHDSNSQSALQDHKLENL